MASSEPLFFSPQHVVTFAKTIFQKTPFFVCFAMDFFKCFFFLFFCCCAKIHLKKHHYLCLTESVFFFEEFLFVAKVVIDHPYEEEEEEDVEKCGNHPLEDLAKSNYKLEIKYKSLISFL
jgi:hypothetical protein